ncbi:MAG: Na/Pi cotransporter family protein [Pseudomonadota bacterium]
MSGTFTLISIAGAVALLLWATRMVRTGVDRAYGTQMRWLQKRAASTRLGAAAAGLCLAVGLQGSTAVALLVAGSIASGISTPGVGLAVLLGADLGAALVVQVLSLDLSLLIPLLLLIGVATFLTGHGRAVRQAGRIIVGIALILVALKMIGEASVPLRESRMVPLWTSYLAADPLIAFMAAAVLTWAMHSGVAAVLLIVSLTANAVISLPLALVFVLGANLGSGVIAVVLTRNQTRQARQVPLANLIVRGTCALAMLAALQGIDIPRLLAGLPAATTAAMFHVGFNLIVLIVGLLLIRQAIALAGLILPSRRPAGDPDGPAALTRETSLDPDMVGQPRQALAAAIREILNMSDTVSVMLREVMAVLETGDREKIQQIAKMDDAVDRQHMEIKLYLAGIGRQPLSADESHRCLELTGYCIKLEQAGDIIVKNLLSLAAKKRALDVDFSKQGWRELRALHDRVSANLQLALNVLVSGDKETARELIEEKDHVRHLERVTTDQHMARLRSGSVKAIETSEIHLDAVRDLKQINGLLTSAAYPILEESGELLDSRLVSGRTGDANG